MFLYNNSGLSGPFAPEDEYISELNNKQQEKEREALEKDQLRQERKRESRPKKKKKDKQHKKHNKKVKKKNQIPKSDSESDAEDELDTLCTKCNMPYFDEENAPTPGLLVGPVIIGIVMNVHLGEAIWTHSSVLHV